MCSSDLAAAIEDRLGAPLPAEPFLRDETGAERRPADLVGARPILLVPVDLDCPNICGLTVHDLFDALRKIDGRPGRDYDVVLVSIDPTEGPADAAAYRARLADAFEEARGALVLTGDARPLLEALGFTYSLDDTTAQYAHPAAVAVLTPDGRLARWLYGYPFVPFDLRLALSEASDAKIGRLAERLWLLCYAYDPETGRYTASVMGALQAGGVLTVLMLGGGIGLALHRERRKG